MLLGGKMTIQPSPLGAHIPLIYHFAMLQDQQRVASFREAIDLAVKPGARVLELGGGTGILSFFAAQRASKVYCVEVIPENAEAAAKFLGENPNGDRVEVICADAFSYLPPEPVDVVICEMLHVGMVREQQIAVIESFKQRYRAQFGDVLPRFIPEAFIQAIQPISYDFNFFGYQAPVMLFQLPGNVDERCRELADPLVFQTAQYKDRVSAAVEWGGATQIRENGICNATRWILKNVLAIAPEQNRAVFWHNQYMILPLEQPLQVSQSEELRLYLTYHMGCEVSQLSSAVNIFRPQPAKSLASRIRITTEAESTFTQSMPEGVSRQNIVKSQ